MKIIRKDGKGYSDYYDYLQGVLGQDELVVYDRRDALLIDPSKPCYKTYIDLWFCQEKDIEDKPKQLTRFSKKRSIDDRNLKKNVLEGRVIFFALEIGYYRYIFEIERYLDDNKNIHIDPILLGKKRVERKDRLSEAPINLCPFYYTFLDKDALNGKPLGKDYVIKNPLLKNTYITKFISANDVWNEVYDYISSLKDKEFVDTRTNDEHIESHGFDKKISFRHRK